MNIVEQYQAFLKEGLFTTKEQDMAKHVRNFTKAMGHDPEKSTTPGGQAAAHDAAAHVAEYSVDHITSTHKPSADFNNSLAKAAVQRMAIHHGERQRDPHIPDAVKHAKKIKALLLRGR